MESVVQYKIFLTAEVPTFNDLPPLKMKIVLVIMSLSNNDC
jgi:hypothetical protein